MANDWTDKADKLRANEPYKEYDQIVNDVITRSRGMAHCDQWVLHSPGECEFCDMYPQLQSARDRLMINFTGRTNPDRVQCPAEVMRPLEKIERWSGNVTETPERKAERDEYWKQFNEEMRKLYPDLDAA